MSSDLEKSGEGTEAVGQKHGLRSACVDDRFDAVDAALVEQRQYTEFAFDKLSSEMRSGFEAINGRLNGVDGQFKGVNGKFKDVEGRFNRVDRRLNGIDDRLEKIDRRFDGMETRFDGMAGRFDGLERKLDQFIDTRSKTNALVERRLGALEPRSAQE